MVGQLILRTQGGFSNRLRAIVSAVLWAEDMDRELVIYWPIEPGHLPCALGDLIVPESIPRVCCVHAGYLSGARQVLSVNDMGMVSQMFEHEKEIRIESYAQFHPEDTEARGLVILRQIRILPELDMEAERLWKNLGGCSKWLAVHFCGTDHRKSLAQSLLAVFFERIDNEFKNPNILLITDENDVKGVFRDRYSGLVVTTDLSLGRRTMEEQRAGVIEWLLLQKCGAVLGSVGSSFSELAARRSGACAFLAASPEVKTERAEVG
jgi:hypothetical protein